MDVDDWLLPQPEDTVPSSGLRTPEGALEEHAFSVLVDYATDGGPVCSPETP